jgi:ERCC4-type nuclease
MILVDSRIGSSFTSTNGRKFDILAALKERTNGNAGLTTLDSGDFVFEGCGPNGTVYIGIERKALGDALGSMRSNRYAGDQAKRMSDAYDICYLFIEGLYRPSKDGLLETHNGREWKPFTLAAKGPQSRQYWQYSELDKHIVSMENKKNVIMVRSTSPMETVWQIVNRYQWWQKPWDSHKSCDPIKLQAEIRFAEVTLLRDMASRIPGIGWEKSKLVEDYFGTIERMATALSSEWREAGFGEKLAVKFYGLMRGKK